MKHTVKLSFDDSDWADLLLAAGHSRPSDYCRRVALTEAGKHRKRLSKTAQDVLRAEVEGIIKEILESGAPIWGNAARGEAKDGAA